MILTALCVISLSSFIPRFTGKAIDYFRVLPIWRCNIVLYSKPLINRYNTYGRILNEVVKLEPLSLV